MTTSLNSSEKKAKSTAKRFANHQFATDREGDEYGASSFGGFPQYFRNKKIKLQNKNAFIRETYGADSPQLFAGMVMTVNGYTNPGLNDLNVMIVKHGGVFLQYMDGKTNVTHIIASSLTPKKKVELARYKVVKPQWVVDCIEQETLLPWSNYRIVEEAPAQSLLGFGSSPRIGSGSTGTPTQVGFLSQRERAGKNYSSYRDKAGSVEKSTISLAEWKLAPDITQVEETDVGVEVVSNEEEMRMHSYRPSNDSAQTIDNNARISLETIDDNASILLSQLQVVSAEEPGNDSIVEEMEEDSWDVEDDLITAEDVEAMEEEYRKASTAAQHRLPQSTEPSEPRNAAVSDEDSPPAFIDEDEQEVWEAEDDMVPFQHDVDHRSPADNLDIMNAIADKELDAPPALAELADATSKDSFFLPAKRPASDDSVTPAKKLKMSAAENNAAILANPKTRADTAVDPNFINKYYAESRLHHLSNWKAELKAHFLELAQQASKPTLLRPGARRYVLHVDFDCFFAAISSLKRPDLKGKPVGIGHSSGPSSEIASCNYAAREFGVKNGMWMKQAIVLCPDIAILPYDFPGYESASKAFYDVILSLGARAVQSVSIDECLVDITNLCIMAGSSTEDEEAKVDIISTDVRDRIREKTGCDVSVGAGANILLAKLALRKAKPAGQYQIRLNEVLDFLSPLSCKDLPSVGYSLQSKIENDLKCETISDLRELTIERLKTLGPKTGERLYEYARGIDKTPVGEVAMRKSVSVDVNWGIRFDTQAQAEQFMLDLGSELSHRLSKINSRGTHLTIKVMKRALDAPLNPPKYMGHGVCDTFNKTTVLGVPSNNPDLLSKEGVSLLRLVNCPPAELRGLALQMTKLSPAAEGLPASQKKLTFGAGSNMKHDTKSLYESSYGKENAKPVVKEEKPMFRMPKKQMPPMMSQFVVPSQIDPNVLKSLPEDMQARINMEQARKAATKVPSVVRKAVVVPAPEINPRPKSSSTSVHQTNMSASSQIDPEYLAALPEDMRAEILADFAASKGRQTLLPQSPRKNKIVSMASRAKPSPQKKKGGNLFSTAGRNQGAINAFAKKVQDDRQKAPPSSPPEGMDADFLANIPEDIRLEILAAHKAEREREKSRAAAAKERAAKETEPAVPVIERYLLLPPKPKKPELFGTSELPKLRNLIVEWFNRDSMVGPHEDDIREMADYVSEVVLTERDCEKAVAFASWFGYVVEEGYRDGGVTMKDEWTTAVAYVKACVQHAGELRGVHGLGVE